MVDQALVQYIKQYLDAGYDINVLRNYLISYGYPADQVDEAVQSLYKEEPKKHDWVAISIVVLFIGLVSLGSFTFLKFRQIEPIPLPIPHHLLDVSAEVFTKAPYPGEPFIFKVQVTNMGNTPRFDINVTYIITNKDSRKVIYFDRESKAIETTLPILKELDLPAFVTAGVYVLDVVVGYGNQSAPAKVEFEVFEKQAVPTPGCIRDGECLQGERCVEGECIMEVGCLANIDCELNEECVDNECVTIAPQIECIGDADCDPNEACVSGSCELKIITPQCRQDRDCGTDETCVNGACILSTPECRLNSDCGESQECQDGRCIQKVDRGPFYGLPIREIVNRIVPVAEENPRQAALLCNGIERLPDKERCLIAVAEVSKDILYCDYIDINRSAYDSCLLNLAYQGDYTVCDYIVSKTKSDMCYALQRIHLINVGGSLNETNQETMGAFYSNTTVLTLP